MACVGIVYGDNNSPLYCIDQGSTYHVINGNWDFSKKSKYIQGDKRLPWRVVIPNMTGYSDYNEACIEIEERAKCLMLRKFKKKHRKKYTKSV